MLQYNIIKNTFYSKGNVEVRDDIKNTSLSAQELTYFKNQEKMITSGETFINIKDKKNEYDIESQNIIYLIKKNQISSIYKTKISDKNKQVYFLEKFKYEINKKILKGKDVLVITNYNLPNSDKSFFSDAIINIENNKFLATDFEINIHKNIFNNPTNDPRLMGVSVKGDKDIILINKGIFTSCNKNQDCPPWVIKAEKIEHNKKKKQITYENAVLNIFDIPILYFPKFFHPDPSVNRQSGLLKPAFNNSNILGSSITLPYFNAISENKDLTFTPTFFDNNTNILNTEYREINKNFSVIADVGYVSNFKSGITKKTKNLNHFFGSFNFDLNFKNFKKSEITGTFERVSNDKYLKVFENYITNSHLRPNNFDKLQNNINFNLTNDDYNFESGMTAYETLNGSDGDRYQYILPYYNYQKTLKNQLYDGSLIFSSIGSNDLNSTNRVDTSLINDLSYQSQEFFTNKGFKTSFKIDLKNSNVVGKDSSKYKSSPQSELVSLINTEISYPLKKENNQISNILVPKLSLRFNPTDMKNYSNSDNRININNIFLNNRLGLSDTFESGKSMTLGLDYKRESKNDLSDINKYFELKLATVFRDKVEKSIPVKSTLNRKNSNIFGSIDSKFSENFELNYDFSIDNDLSTFEYNDLGLTFSNNNLITSFNLFQEKGEIGDTDIFKTSVQYNLNDRNLISFNTRRNRKINLTEYYDLVYEYKYDCLTAGIKYKKNYYSDGDLKPTENLLFTITLFPLTNYEYDAKDLLEN